MQEDRHLASDAAIESAFRRRAIRRKYDGLALRNEKSLFDLMVSLGLPLSSRATHIFFEKFDVDHNKVLDLQEVKALVRAYEHELSDAFSRYDLNEDGVLDKNEIKLALEGLHIHVSSDLINDFFVKYDDNHDGCLSFPEFVKSACEMVEWRPTQVIAQIFHLEPRLPGTVTDRQVK